MSAQAEQSKRPMHEPWQQAAPRVAVAASKLVSENPTWNARIAKPFVVVLPATFGGLGLVVWFRFGLRQS
jgi:hypothetical protein